MPVPTKPVISPHTLEETRQIFTGAMKEVDARTGEPVADEPTPAANAAPSVADAVASVPELAEVQRQFGEAGVAHVVNELRGQHIRAEHEKLNAAIPGWSDPETRAQIVSEIRAHALAEGFSEQEINAVTDSRTVKIAYAAMRKAKLQEQHAADAAQADAEAPTPRRAPRAQRKPELAAALDRVKQTGRQRDAQAAIELMGLAD